MNEGRSVYAHARVYVETAKTKAQHTTRSLKTLKTKLKQLSMFQCADFSTVLACPVHNQNKKTHTLKQTNKQTKKIKYLATIGNKKEEMRLGKRFRFSFEFDALFLYVDVFKFDSCAHFRYVCTTHALVCCRSLFVTIQITKKHKPTSYTHTQTHVEQRVTATFLYRNMCYISKLH